MDRARKIPGPYQFITVLWFSFLLAIVPTGILFSIIDPLVITECLAAPGASRLAVYSIGFLVFWLLCACSGLISTFYLSANSKSE